MPLYDYRCPNGHTTTRLFTWRYRPDRVRCRLCDSMADWQFPVPHCLPDGVYSYAENIGSPDAFERKEAKIADRERRRRETGKV